jgi:SAM-dependent methyltransferase
MNLKRAIKSIPFASSILTRFKVRSFRGSRAYWEDRYSSGGLSGAGSYGAIAEFKSNTLNRIVSENAVDSVVEFGCGDGNQLSLSDYRKYLGLDVSGTAIDICTNRFALDKSKSFILYDPTRFLNNGWITADMAISLDVILHLVEDSVFEQYMTHLFESARKLVVVFAEDHGDHRASAHVRFRDWLPWVQEKYQNWGLIQRIENPHCGPDSQAHFFIFTLNE